MLTYHETRFNPGVYRINPNWYHWPAEINGRVLDVGCATGVISEQLAKIEEVAEVIALDVDPQDAVSYLAASPWRKKIKFIHADFRNFTDAVGFDFIHCSSVLLHIFDFISFLRKVYALLKPAGRFCLSTAGYEENHNAVIHYKGGIPIAHIDKECTTHCVWQFGKQAMRNVLETLNFKDIACVNSFNLETTEAAKAIGQNWKTFHYVWHCRK